MKTSEKIKKAQKKDIEKRHKRKSVDLQFAHNKIVLLIAFFALVALAVAWLLDVAGIAFWSSIVANIFAGLITGLVICLIAGTKQITIAKLESQKSFLETLSGKIKEFQTLYNELLRRPFTQYDGTEELFDFIYDVGAHANWVNDFILQGSFDELLALNPREYCKEMGYDAFDLADTYEELHINLYGVDVDCPTKKHILQYFEKVEKALRGLNNSAFHKIQEIDSQLEKIKYSLF